jgi:hypothetical protein
MTKSQTVPLTTVNGITGERHIIQLKPRGGMTAKAAQAFRARRIKEGKRIDPETCEVMAGYARAVDPYNIFEEPVPDEWSWVGKEFFARNLPDGHWVWFGDLPEETYKALFERLGWDPISALRRAPIGSAKVFRYYELRLTSEQLLGDAADDACGHLLTDAEAAESPAALLRGGRPKKSSKAP